MDKPNQRKGANSSTEVGEKFENAVQEYFIKKKELGLEKGVKIAIGFETKKEHAFDLVSHDKKVIVECKSHTWSKTGNSPSGKLANWSQEMLYFNLTPKGYRKIMFVLRDVRKGKGKAETLATYYIRTRGHLIPPDVEFWEYDEAAKNAKRLK